MSKYKAEFHVHTRYSKDSILTYIFILLMAKIKHINTLAITDHNEIIGAIKYKKKLEKHGINVIIGEEIYTTNGEIIGLFLTEKIKPNLTVEETINQIKSQNGIIYVPHPYDEKRYKTVLDEEEISKNKELIDFIEIHNGRNIKNYFSTKQKEIQEKYSIKGIIGSDAHTFFELGRNYITTSIPIKTKEDLLNINYECNNKKCLSFSHKWTKVAKTLKLIGKGKFNELYRTITRRS